MGCGASVTYKPPITPRKPTFTFKRVLGRRRESTTTSTCSSNFQYSSSRQNQMDQQMKALCFANVRSIFHRKTILPSNSRRSSRRRKTVDARFVEERVICDVSDEDIDDAATEKTNSTASTRLTVESNDGKGKDEKGQQRSFFRIAMDYNKRMDAIKNFRPTKSTIQPTPLMMTKDRKESFQRLNEPAAIVQHVSRREFLENSACISTPPPLIRRVITPTNTSIRGSRETLMSERSFIAVHNTLRVAWEKEMCYEKIQEQTRQQRLKQAHLRWHSVDSSCAETSSCDSMEEPQPLVKGTNRLDWSRELDKIIQLN